MNHLPSPRAVLAAVAASAFLLGLSACAVPLAPQYQIVKETFDIRFVSGANPEVKIHSVYTLQNNGTADLDFVDVVFPPAKVYSRANLTVESGGQSLTPADLPLEYQQDSPGAQRLNFPSRWRPKETRDLTIDYAFSPPSAGDQNFALGPEAFHLAARGWLPVFLRPNHILADTPSRPEKLTYTVRVPSDFTVLARGSLASRKQDGNDTIYHFELRKQDLGPYVVAGHYLTSNRDKKPAGVVFWTTKQLPQNATSADSRLADAWTVLQKNFGAVDKQTGVPYIVEAPSLQSSDASDEAAYSAFPGGVFINSAALNLGVTNEVFVERVERGLARTWFDDAMQPAPFAALALGDGLPSYATIVMDQAAGGDAARRKRIVALLRSYDDARAKLTTPEKSVVATVPEDSPEQHRIAEAKAPLLFIALEDAAGSAHVRSGLAQAIQLLRGKEVSVNDIRAAIEFTTSQNLSGPFRAWLYNPGIPSDFRSRYGPSAENEKAKLEKGN